MVGDLSMEWKSPCLEILNYVRRVPPRAAAADANVCVGSSRSARRAHLQRGRRADVDHNHLPRARAT
jgi:hypothetical protein